MLTIRQVQECWHVPEPDLHEPLPLQQAGNVILDNCEHELLALILSRPAEELQNNQDISQPASAVRDFERALSCQDCVGFPSTHTCCTNLAVDDKHPSSRRMGSKLFNEADRRTQYG